MTAPPTPPTFVALVMPPVTKPELDAALAALDRIVGPTGREAKAVKAAVVPMVSYLHALQEGIRP